MGMSKSYCGVSAPDADKFHCNNIRTDDNSPQRSSSCVNNNTHCEFCGTEASSNTSNTKTKFCETLNNTTDDEVTTKTDSKESGQKVESVNTIITLEVEGSENGNVETDINIEGSKLRTIETRRIREYHSKSLPKKLKDSVNNRTKCYLRSMTPPCRFTPDGTLVNYWCDMPQHGLPGSHGMLLACCMAKSLLNILFFI